MTYEGCLKAEKTGNQVKLLGYDQIQELFRKELTGLEEKVPMKYLYLTYVRVADETKPNRYCFIPAWCMSPYQLYETLNHGMIDESGVYTTTNPEGIIWLNAIDGTRIEPKKAGFLVYRNWEEEYDELERQDTFTDDSEIVEPPDDYWEEEEAAKERREKTLIRLPDKE